MLSEEVSRVRGEGGEKVRELEGRVRDQAERLAAYQKVETEMDDVVLQAAQGQQCIYYITICASGSAILRRVLCVCVCVCVCDIAIYIAESESDAEKILFSYGFGASLPTTACRRAQQRSVTPPN